jgi:hypothetical protein
MAVTKDVLSRKANRKALADLVSQIADEGLSWTACKPISISSQTKDGALSLLRGLPLNIKAPKISPDGDGGLMLVWDDRHSPTLLVVDGWKLHLVKAATTPNAEYFDDVHFSEGSIPSEIVSALPKE